MSGSSAGPTGIEAQGNRQTDLAADRPGHQDRPRRQIKARMIALRLVMDMNIVVSAALKPDGLHRTVLVLAITKPARLYVSEVVIAEYREVLARPELKIRKGLRQQVLQSQTVALSRPLRITPDPDDNIFLECADDARAAPPPLSNA
jgi:hypothetical protein